MDLRLDAVSAGYGGAEVVHALSFTLEAGAIGCLLGPSGSGKTTALRAIAGFEPVRGGTIALGGRTLSGPGLQRPPEERGIGMVFQDYALLPHLTALQNVQFGLHRSPPAQRTQRARERRPFRTSCPAASSSAWRWPARWRRGPRCCCSTSRSRASTPSCASAWGRTCAASCAARA
jgi:ABC-type sulfate/molybdate transport systems ATPase subunit